MKKILWPFGIGLLVLIIVVGIAVGLYIGPIVKIGMEEVGPQIAKVSIKVDAVDIFLLTGSAKIKGLIVGNPNGYKTPQAISVGTVAVSVNPFSVLSNKIIVRSVHVESPEITFEGGLGSNNLSKIMNNVNALAQKGKETGNKPASKIEVDDFLITGAKVHVILTSLGNKEMTLPLPNIHLTDMGKGSNGLTPVELTRAVLDAIISGTIKVVTSSVTQLGHSVQNLGKGVGQTVGGSVNKITNSIGGLFGK
jgi:uncharacterized protein involved in outer membrane biogenesis